MSTTRRPALLFHLPLEPVRLLRARHRIRDYLHEHTVEAQAIDDVVIAIEEAMTNAVRHSDARKDLEVSLRFDGRDLVTRVKDEGKGFDLADFDPDRLPDPLEPCGRGLYLIAHLMDDLRLSVNGGLEVVAVKRQVLASNDGHEDAGERLERSLPDARVHRDSRQRAMLEEIEEAFYALDWEYRYSYLNGAFERLLGRSRGELLGERLWDTYPTLRATPAAGALHDAMEIGRPSIVEYVSPSRGRWLELRAYPTSTGVSVYLRDIDERKHLELERDESRRRAELLAQTAAALLATDDPQGVVDDLCAEVMAYLACDVFFNYLVDEGSHCLRLNAWAGIPEEEARKIESLGFGVAVCGCSALEKRPIVSEDIQHSDDERAELVRGFGVQAYAAHPLTVLGEVIGTLSFGTRARPTFTPDELSLMRTVADYVAIAIDRKRSETALRESERRLRAALDGRQPEGLQVESAETL